MSSGYVNRAYRKLRGLTMGSRLRRYLAGMTGDNPLRGLPAGVVGDAYGDPTEFFSHYDAFAFWAASRIAKIGRRRKIIDIGSRKMQVAMLSASHEVTSLVLADCSDQFSNVRYVLHDVSDPLPFTDRSFDCFTSTVSLPLIGLGRYGDKVDPNSLPNLIRELGRVMQTEADLFISLCLGPNFLAFNNGWYLELDVIKRLFKGWTLAETVVDTGISAKGRTHARADGRFVSPDAAPTLPIGDHWVAFLHFRRTQGSDR